MTQRLKAPVEPRVLEWARKSASLNRADAAKKIGGIDEGRLALWEQGEDAPTMAQLRKLATAYKRPIAVFFLDEPPNELGFSALRDFRRFASEEARAFSPQLAYEIRAADERRNIALEVFAALGETPPVFTLTAEVTDDPEEVARRFREVIGIAVADQVRWRDPTKAFKAWREAIEAAGVLVFVLSGAHHQVKLAEARGFALAMRPLPVAVVNGKDRPGGRIFTLLHELGHILLGQTAIDNDPEPEPGLRSARVSVVETFANRFAAAVLMPRDALLAEPLVAAQRRVWEDDDIAALAGRYSVSREALLLRLVQLGRADASLFNAKREQFARQYAEADEAAGEDGGFAPYRYQVLGHLGRTFARLVLQGYYQNRLSLSAVSGYLGIQAKHVAGIEQAAFARSG